MALDQKDQTAAKQTQNWTPDCSLQVGIRKDEKINNNKGVDNSCTVEPRYNEPLFNKLLGITNIFCPGKSYGKMYGTEPRFNELLDLTNWFRQPKL